ncbi:MAG: M56 family metallopeptidase [Eubacterium sp.]|nr:M56 family metallopeptidase [Eubacterium sp.]
MGDVFLKLLNMSITAGWFLLAVFCIRLAFRKIPKWVNCLLWGVAAIRLVCPFSIESQFSLLPSTEPIKSSTIVEGKIQHEIPSIDSHLTIVEHTINPMLAEAFAYNEAESAAPLQVAAYAAGIVWVCGIVLLVLCAAGSILKLYKLVREAVCVSGSVYICDAVTSPFILGIIKPRIYLSSALCEKEMHYILAHESAHLKRKDHWWKLLGYILLCVYWFHPLCWAAYATFCKDLELACDEKVVKDMAFHEKKEYSNVLLSCTRRRSLMLVCPLAFGEVGVKERVKYVLHYKKPALWVMIAAAAAVALLAVCFLTNPVKEYQVRITIPAKHTESFCYADTEISPKGSTITCYAGEGLKDAKIRLLPVKAGEEAAYESAYVTPGMPVEIDAKKGAWFKIGVNRKNPTEESEDVYISVKNVEVRIASKEDPADSQPEKSRLPQTEETAAKAAGKDADPKILLSEQPKAGKVCIKVQPSVVREYHSYYYVPTGKAPKWLSEQLEELDLSGGQSGWQPLWEGHKEAGWQILYQDAEIIGFTDGSLYRTYYDEEKGTMECLAEAPDVCSYIQQMLAEEIGYQNVEVSNIKGIVSAKLDVQSASTGWQLYSQTVTDTETLQTFEKWFRNAKYIFGGADCGNECACLELVLANGDTIKLSMATDSCPNFCIDGVAYDYRPAPDWDQREFYKYFDEIP